MARTPRSAPQPTSGPKHFITLVYAGVRSLSGPPSKRPKTAHLYYEVPDDWEANPILGEMRTFGKRVGSGSVGAVHRAEREAPNGSGSLRIYASAAGFKGFWRDTTEVMQWQAKHQTVTAEVAAWEQRKGATPHLIREQLEPLKRAMRGLTRNEKAVFLSMVVAELTSETTVFF